MQDSILLLACIAITVFLGWNLIYLVRPRTCNARLFPFEALGLSFLLGIGAITIQMFLMRFFGIAFTRFNILIPWILIIITNLFLRKKPTPTSIESGNNIHSFGKFDIALIILISLQTAYNFFRALLKPIESHDAVAIYGLKSKIMYLASGIPNNFFQDIGTNFHGAHPDYPLLVPLAETWIYTFLGKFSDILVKAIFPLFFIAFIFIFYRGLVRITKNSHLSLLFTFLLASVKQFSDYSTIGVADLALGIYFTVAILYLYLWFEDRKNKTFLNISLAASILTLWTKNEGMLLVFIIAFIFLVYAVTNRQNFNIPEFARLALYIFLIAFLLIGWAGFKNYQGLVNENFSISILKTEGLTTNLYKIPIVLYGYQKEFFGFKKWNIFWIIFMIIFAWKFKKAFSGNLKYITLAIFLFFSGYMVMYIYSVVEVRWFVRVTASRFLLHIFPITIFWLALVTHKEKLLENRHE